MIFLLDHKNRSVAKKIHSVFQSSYAVEAKILGAEDFPPLKRTVSELKNSASFFYGYYQKNLLLGVVETYSTKSSTHIQSLVVEPKHFRIGVGKSLVLFVLENSSSVLFSVETGLKNTPAINLYLNFGFKETKQWNTDHGVRKIRFEKKLH